MKPPDSRPEGQETNSGRGIDSDRAMLSSQQTGFAPITRVRAPVFQALVKASRSRRYGIAVPDCVMAVCKRIKACIVNLMVGERVLRSAEAR